MPLRKVKQDSNMYQGWITHTHSHLAGECPHNCRYCYVKKMGGDRYKGELRLVEEELNINYGKGKKIFIEHMNDLFAKSVPDDFIYKILEHCREYPLNIYIFQTKNPYNALQFIKYFPNKTLFGTTIETNRCPIGISKAPHPFYRWYGISHFKEHGMKLFITVEPIMDFDVWFADLLIKAEPDFINIGADSKCCGLPEPSREKIIALIKELKEAGIKVNCKSNLRRLLDG